MKSAIANHQRLIVALDFADIKTAKNLVNELGDEVSFYKIGLELFMSGDYFELIEFLAQKNKKIFADLKLMDISVTVGKAVKNLSRFPNIDFLTIHAASKDIMRAASENKGHMKILAVTVLTNLSQNDLVDMGFNKDVNIEELVLKKAKLAESCAIDGVVASGLEAGKIRYACKKDFLIVTPGVRLEDLKNDDQKRTVDVKTAFKNGADYIVVGRPIHSSTNPLKVAQKIQQEINNIF
jgi:orotidine-5'-phosphate decarboxylase